MDAFKALAAQQGCSVDGTAATNNPLSKLINKIGSDNRNFRALPNNPQNRSRQIPKAQSHPRKAEFIPPPQNQIPQPRLSQNGWSQEFLNNQPRSSIPQSQRTINHQLNPQMQFQQNQNMNQLHQMPMRMHQHHQSFYAPQMQNFQPMWRNNQSNSQHLHPQNQQQAARSQKSKSEVVNSKAKDNLSDVKDAANDIVQSMSQDPKMRESNFFNEMQKVASGESDVAKDSIKTSSINAAQISVSQDPQNVLEEAFDRQQRGEEIDLDAVFSKALGNNERFQQSGFEQSWANAQKIAQAYEFQSENKFLDHTNYDSLFELAMELFNDGELSEAILAFQAIVDKDQSNSEAWRMLGVVHQELDEDRKAIACLEHAKEQDPYNLNALLELGVSYVNELDQRNALTNLKAWVENNPQFAGIKVDDIYGGDSEDLMHDVAMLMAKVEEFAPQDADVQIVLGVLYNVSHEYEEATAAFQKALNQRPDDYSLWNKLGATLANSSKSSEALPVYTRALELKPKYARAWLNYGISHSNLGDYAQAIRAYLKALDLNPDAIHIWGYLRICLTVSDGLDHLLPAVSNRDMDAFRKVFDF